MLRSTPPNPERSESETPAFGSEAGRSPHERGCLTFDALLNRNSPHSRTVSSTKMQTTRPDLPAGPERLRVLSTTRCYRYRTFCPSLLFLLVLLAVPLQQTRAQQTGPPASEAPRVYLDCPPCDSGYIRREIDFINYVRDRQEAQVHVLVTHERTGSGGQSYTLNFIGLQNFRGQDHRLTYTTQPSDTQDEERSGLVRILKLGLVPYLLQTPLADRISLAVDDAGAAPQQPAADPWNGWVFEAYADGYADVEASQKSLHIRYGFYADRVTEQWRIRLRPYFNYNLESFESDGQIITSESRRDGFDSYVVRSLGPHWSAGLFADAITTTFDNIDLRLRASPAVEYSVFPYREASRRELTFAYRFGASHVAYMDTTIFGKISEALLYQALDANFEVRQPWGSIDVGAEGSHFLHDASKYRLEFDGGVSLRLVRGLALRLGAEVELIHDQLNLPRGDASLEEILLRQRQLATTYEVSASIGFSYTFGSIYNNVVNTRL